MEHFCLNIRDVDECALGLTNCSGVALCKDLPIGYSCSCVSFFSHLKSDIFNRV